MKRGDVIYINGDKWCAAIDKSTKTHKMFELWQIPSGRRMAYLDQVIPIEIFTEENINIVEKMTKSRFS